MTDPEPERWLCARCGDPQPFVLDTPCQCGCWWLTTSRDGVQGTWRHVGGPHWPEDDDEAEEAAP